MSLNREDQQILLELVKLIEDKKGDKIEILDMREHSIALSFFILANGDNPKHVRAIAENLEENFSANLLRKEGLESGAWVVLDFGEYFVHIFDEEVRLFYDLEGLWADFGLPLEALEEH